MPSHEAVTKMFALRIGVFSWLPYFALAQSHIERQINEGVNDSTLFTDRATYIAHKWFSSIVVGNYLYIDGGEIFYQNGNDTVQTEAKNTYSIDLSSSWTNATVSIKQIDNAIDGRALNSPKLWPGLDKSTFFSYNGEKAWFTTPANPPANKLYKFTSDGVGAGQWSEDDESYTASSNFTNLARVAGSASACGPDTCYVVGGWRNSRTDNTISDEGKPAAGVVSYNLSSSLWYNDSLISTTWQGPWFWGNLFFTDVAGSKGILVAMGGSTSGLAGENPHPLSFEYVYLYDIATKTWYTQSTGGDVPDLPRAGYCAVGLPGTNGGSNTYEVRHPTVVIVSVG